MLRRGGASAFGAAAVVALLAIAGPGGAAATSTGSCKKPDKYVVAVKTSKAVVFTNRHGYRAYGCLFRRGKLVRLSGAVGKYKLAGSYVAYFLRFGDEEGMFYRVMVRDLRTGGFRHIEAAYSDLPERRPDDGESPAKVTNLKLKRTGAVAWISCSPSEPGETTCRAPQEDLEWEVWRSDSNGRKLLDSSPSVRLRSLELKGSALEWRHGSETRTATLH
jgi:hypothetical protein